MEALPMNGGVDLNSYAKNSSYQRDGVLAAFGMLKDAISFDLDGKHSANAANPFRIADLGCSVGPNTFEIVQAIIEHVKPTLASHGDVPQFEVFFNDLLSNDFNTLFRSPRWGDGHYFAAAVPGSFHGRLFPDSFINLVHCSYALHWLSALPEEVVDERSPAWNKGKISMYGAGKRTSEAFLAKFGKDVGCFLQARAIEIVPGGFMLLVIPAQVDREHPPQFHVLFQLLESALLDMVHTGRLEESRVDSFNFPFYFPTAEEFETVVERYGSFSVEKIQPLSLEGHDMPVDASRMCKSVRAMTEGYLSKHFGREAMDEAFERFLEKTRSCSQLVARSMHVSQNLVVLLKRKFD